jgi:NAD(P)-dependent dehydrogenase (short-subunit alcohol dehydrogenase family)
MPDLKKQIAVVTGASGRIGGHRVSVHSRRRSRCGRLRGLAGAADAFRADLTRDDDLSGLAEHVSHTSGRLDILLHIAGVYARGELEKSSINTNGCVVRRKRARSLFAHKRTSAVSQKTSRANCFHQLQRGPFCPPETGQFSATQQAFKVLPDGLPTT